MFRETRDDNGHYVNMRDFLRPEMVEDVLHYAELNLTSSKPTFPTNCFTIGSMAIDDLTPSLGTDDGNSKGKWPKVHIRLPKFPLADEDGRPIKPESLPADEMALIAEYFHYAITPTQRFRGADELPANYSMHTDRIPYQALIARNLMDALDADNIPGGSQPHSRAKINRGDYDPYVSKMGFSRMNWDRLPCTEPIPMLDNIVLVAGDGNNPALELKANHADGPDGAPGGGAVTNVSAILRVGLYANSAIYAGWSVPRDAEGKYGYIWKFSNGIDNFDYAGDVDENAFQKPFEAGAAKANFHNPKGTFELKADDPQMRWNSDGFVPAFEIRFTIENVSSVEEAKTKIPNEFGFAVYATGILFKGSDDNSDIRQVAPCLAGNDSWDDIKNHDSQVWIDLWFQKDHLISPDPNNAHIVGAAYCVDPMFACVKDSWIPSLSPSAQGGTSPEERLRDAITIHDENSFMDGVDHIDHNMSINPLAALYLTNPRKRLGTSTVFGVLKDNGALRGGCCDVMWGNPAPNGDEFPNNRCDKPKEAALAFYLDPKETDKTSPYAFTRVGQLGFLPIGTYRTIALLDGWGTTSGGDVTRVSRQRVLDYFTMHPSRDNGTSGSGTRVGKPVKAASFTSRVNINPPRTVARKTKTGDGKTWYTLETDDFNPKPLAAILNGCPLREWYGGANSMPISWEVAELIADGFLEAIDPQSGTVFDDSVEDEPRDWNAEGIVHDISVLGRCVPNDLGASIDGIVRNETKSVCDFDREGIIRNTSEMLTARQQLFTILVKADSFTPKFGYNDAEHGTSLASVHAIAHVWRDPEPLRDADGLAVRDRDGNPIYPWILLDMYQF